MIFILSVVLSAIIVRTSCYETNRSFFVRQSTWQLACSSASCIDTVNNCVEAPYFCITPAICDRCGKAQSQCYACHVSLSSLAPQYLENGPQTFRVAGMVSSCNPTTRPLCRFACRYQSWNEGVCDANNDCICRMNLESNEHVFGFLTPELSSSLVDLIGFPKTDTWSNIYQGQTHGFTASNFHSRCDGQSKVLVIVKAKNGNIFGGFSDVGWGSVCSTCGGVFKTDTNAFVFSLVNSNKRPVKFKPKKDVISPIYWYNNYGPTMGYFDFRIDSNAHTNTNSISDLGYSFDTTGTVNGGTDEARSFLAGSYNFMIEDIAVYKRFPLNNYFLSDKMFSDLVNLIEMPKSDTWSLIYKGSHHGFSSSNFHSACDGKLKTLVLIQSANDYIFGGYTEIGWGSVCSTCGGVFKYDPNAFLFSLTNPSNRPLKFNLKSVSSDSIYWSNSYGPGFGNWDLRIDSLSNTNGNSFSDIGYSYNTSVLGIGSFDTFLTGSKYFVVNEIAIYQRIQSNNYFLSPEMFSALVALTGLPDIGSWNLIYRGSTHGFAASSFHSRCDGKSKTLVIVESVNHYIFGGFTEIGWGSVCSTCSGAFKTDSNAFIFSLTNSNNKPAVFRLRNGSQSQAVYWYNSYGPVFGNFDFIIQSLANANANSFSDLGSTYNTAGVFDINVPGANNFLAGSQYFTINDIVVFQIL